MEPQPNEQQKKTQRYITISFVLHLAFFLSFGIGSFFVPQSLILSPSVQIDMVALPDQLKNQQQDDVDLTKPVKPDMAEPPAPEPEPSKPEPAPKVEPEPAQPDPEEMALEREKQKEKLLKDKKKLEQDAKKRAAEALKKMKEQAEKERKAEEDRRREALDKRKKDLKKFEETYRAAQRGNQKNEGNSLTGELNQGLVNAYQGHLLDRIRSKWALPQYLQGQGLRAVMRMYLDARGNVIKMEFKHVSGNNMFDSYVEGAIRQSSPFAPPPAEMAPGLRGSGVEVQFPL